MQPVKHLTLISILLATSLNAADIDPISLIFPTRYERTSSKFETAKSKTQSGTASTLGTDIEKKVTAKIAPFTPGLVGYFSSKSDMDKFLASIIQRGVREILGDVTDANFIKFYGYLGNHLIGAIAYKILDKEGVTDATRRNLWKDKLLAPFNTCIRNSNNAQYDASHCLDALTASLVPSAGVGIVYELSRQNLNSSLPAKDRVAFNTNLTNLYKNCISPLSPTSTNVKNCVLSSMKAGVVKITNPNLIKTIGEKASSKSKATEIHKIVWPVFESCNQKVGSVASSKVSYSDQFTNCIDDLVQSTGTHLVMDKISSTPSIRDAFPASELKKLNNDEANNFVKCAESQKKKGARKEGMLDLSPCENLTTNSVTYKVVSQTLRTTANNKFKNNKSQATKVGNEGVNLLDKCWNNNQSPSTREVCLRKTIVAFSGNVATLKLNEAIPNDTTGKSKLSNASVDAFTKCIEKELPKNISEANDLDTPINKCTDSMVISTGSKLVSIQVLNTPATIAAFSASELKQLATEKSAEFEKCAEVQNRKNAMKNGIIDTSPCEDAITNDVTYQVAAKTLRNTANDSFKTNKAQATKIGNEGVKLLDKCWTKNQTPPAREACLKNTIVAFSGIVATIRINELIPDNTPGKANITKTSVASLTQCLEKDLPRNISESKDVDKKIDGCISSMIISTGSTLVTNRINNTSAISEALTPSEVKKLAAEKSAKFETCAEAQRKKGAMKNGMLDVSPCEDIITNDVSYQVAAKTLRNTAAESFKTNNAQATKIGNEGVKLLDKCWSKNQPPAAREACLKKTIVSFSGIVATIKIDELIPDNTPGKTNITKTSVASLTQCLEKNLPRNISESNDVDKKIDGCISSMIISTGSNLVTNRINNTSSISDALTPSEVKKLAAEKSAKFETCAEAQRKKGAMKNGMLDVSPCEESITNDVTYRVVSETLRQSAADAFKTNRQQATQVGNDGVKILDKCWNNNQTPAAREACLRNTIVTFSGNVATLKLNDKIPSGMPGKADISKNSVTALIKCIEKELPANISESNNLTAKIDGCSGKLTKDVALIVAEYQVRDSAKEKIVPSEIDALVKSLVQGEFSICIGLEPNEAKLDQCSEELTIKASKNIAGVSFNKEVNAYLNTAGGLQALGVTQAQVNNFLQDLNKTNNECLDKKHSGSSSLMDKVNSCIKGSIKKIAFFFGDVQFKKSIGNMYDGRDADKRSVEEQFRTSLEACLGIKDGKDFSIDDYTKNLYACSEKVSGSVSLTVGKDQVDTSLNQYLKDRPGINLQDKRNEIGTKLLDNFKTCMSSATKQKACIDTLKKAATQTIVINYARVETKVQLNTANTPVELQPVEDKFMACTDSKLEEAALAAKLDDCTKDFALSFAKELGTLKLNYLLKQALGADGFLAQKNIIDSSLRTYYECLNRLSSLKMSDGLTQKLSLCTNELTNNGMSLVKSNINTWMTSDQKDAATVKIKKEFANFLPCLSNLLPSVPYSPQLQQNVESNVKPIVHLLSQYIDYNPTNAKQTLDGIINALSVDLNDVTATKKAKLDLIDFLYESGGLDQFLKAIVRGTVKDSLEGVSINDVPKDLQNILLQKENYEVMFNTPEGLRIKKLVMDTLLRPALIDGADVKGPAIKGSMSIIKTDVIKLLVNAPAFGEQAIKISIQNEINDMPGITKFFARVLYSGDALDWEKVRLTPAGIEAENYIKETVLTPKFKGTVQSPALAKQTMNEAERLVKIAVKSFKR